MQMPYVYSRKSRATGDSWVPEKITQGHPWENRVLGARPRDFWRGPLFYSQLWSGQKKFAPPPRPPCGRRSGYGPGYVHVPAYLHLHLHEVPKEKCYLQEFWTQFSIKPMVEFRQNSKLSFFAYLRTHGRLKVKHDSWVIHGVTPSYNQFRTRVRHYT